jgi:hypothetical protein
MAPRQGREEVRKKRRRCAATEAKRKKRWRRDTTSEGVRKKRRRCAATEAKRKKRWRRPTSEEVTIALCHERSEREGAVVPRCPFPVAPFAH